MNQQTTNSCFINNSSGPANLSAPVAPDKHPATDPESPVPKRAKPKVQSQANRVTPNAAAPRVVSPQVASKTDDRCRRYTVTGRRCRMTILDPASGLCFRHVGLQFQPTDEDLSPAFAGLLSGFESASRIHAFLTQVTVLLVQNCISTRRAAILAYLGQMLLRTLNAVEEELNPDDEQPFIFDLPRPKRDDDISPERSFVNRMAELGARVKTPVAPDGYDGWTSNPDATK